MDTTPLYSAEQIIVPEELADILKQYTKAVIRSQPPNIVEFSARYEEVHLVYIEILVFDTFHQGILMSLHVPKGGVCNTLSHMVW